MADGLPLMCLRASAPPREILHFPSSVQREFARERFWLADYLRGDASFPANPPLAEVLYLAGYVERMGTGTAVMIRRCREQGLPEPEFLMRDGFVVILQRPRSEVTTEVTRLLGVLQGEMSKKELMAVLNLKNDEHFRKQYLVPALEADVMEMTIPDKPQSSKQRYRKKGSSRP